jgi:hypothetical protein
MATVKKSGGPEGFEFDCESLPIAPGTKRGTRMPIDGEPATLSARVWWVVGALVVAGLIGGVLIGRLL